MHARPTSWQVCRIVSYVFSVAIWVIPVSHWSPPPDVFNNAVQALRTSAHMALTVLSADTPNMDSARASKSANDLADLSRHYVVSVVQDRRTSSSLASWASLICASASSKNSSQT